MSIQKSLHIRKSSKFQLQQTILIFCSQKGILTVKNRKMNITFEFFITMLVFSCEAERSCVKLASTRCKVGSCSCLHIGLSSLFCVGSESVVGVGRGAFGALEDPEDFPLQSFKSMEQLM